MEDVSQPRCLAIEAAVRLWPLTGQRVLPPAAVTPYQRHRQPARRAG